MPSKIFTRYNAVNMVELAVEKGAQAVLMPVSSRKQLFDLSDDMATKVDIQFYADARCCLDNSPESIKSHSFYIYQER